MAAAGLGDDLLLANEVLDAGRLGALVARRAPGSRWPSTPPRRSTPRWPAACARCSSTSTSACPLRLRARPSRPLADLARRRGPARCAG